MRALAAVLALLATFAFAQDARPPGRVALVIGNGAYKDAPLPNAPNDAADMAGALQASGFTVIRRDNASLRDMQLALREFGDRLGRGSVGLFYFAGHGVQVRGRNYLVPVDADIAREDEVSFSALDLAAVLEKMDTARNPLNLVILDACRNNPFATRFQLAAPGLAQIDAPAGTLIAFATAPGSVAADGSGRNGLYTHHLLREMARPGAPIEEVFKGVRAGVRRDSAGKQVPWESTSLEAGFAFREAPRPAPKTVAAAAPAGRGATRAAPASLGAPPVFARGDSWKYRPTTYTPASILYAFPLQAGSGWNFSFLQDSEGRLYDVEGSIKVIGEEEVEVPAGRMRALRIERVARWRERGKENAGVNTMTYWYSSAAKRAVAFDNRNASSRGKVFVNERVELEAYDVR